MDTKRVDVNGKNICLNDIVIIGSYDGNTKGYCDVGIVKYNNLNCSFFIKCKYVNIDFNPCLYLKIIDNCVNHRDKTDMEILELYQQEYLKYE